MSDPSPPNRHERSVSRRHVLHSVAATASVAASAALAGCFTPPNLLGGSHSGPGTSAGRPIQFSDARKRIRRTDATHVVETFDRLVDAVGTPNATVWIPGGSTITVPESINTGLIEDPVKVAPGVTIASNRALGKGKGGLITCDFLFNGVFEQSEGDVRITGLRVRGPRTSFWDPPGSGFMANQFGSAPFRLEGNRAFVDHCEIFGWTNAAVLLGSRSTATSGWIHHNQLHHNQMNHLGYGLELYNGEHIVEWNYFNANRHSIAAFGYPTNGYEARYNIVGPSAILFSFDMHNLGENLGNTNNNKAGKYVRIHHNVFTLTDHLAFSIQGIPKQQSFFRNNWCAAVPSEVGGREHIVHQVYNWAKSSGPVRTTDGPNFTVEKNEFGPKAVKRGRQWLVRQARKASGTLKGNSSETATDSSTSTSASSRS